MKISLPAVALTMGEPAGISGEITIKAWRDHRHQLDPFFVIDDPDRLKDLSSTLGWKIEIGKIADPSEALGCFGKSLPVLPVGETVGTTLAQPNPENLKAIICSIDKAVTFARTGEACAVVTNPIHKSTLYGLGFAYPGHTEYLAHLANITSKPVMMLASENLKVVAITRHVSVLEAVRILSPELIIETAEITASTLKKDFGLNEPKMAIAGLNPHAGEGGAMGREEKTIIEPAIKTLQTDGYDVRGPLPSDTLFHAAAREQYDVALCMYHDQALIPIKTLDFYSAVNVTLGLPFIRTSPDHGTALDIAGTGTANETSLVAALKLASFAAQNRACLDERTNNS